MTSIRDPRLSRRFTVVRHLGRGGFGDVYLAEDTQLGIRVALKKLSRTDPGAVYRFKQEFRVLADLSHPNLVRLHELLYLDDGWYLTMDYVEGVPFSAYVREGGETSWSAPTQVEKGPRRDTEQDPPEGRFIEDRLRAALEQLAGGLHAIHDVGLLHRDLKPSNVLVTAEGRVTILDFGLVASLTGPAHESIEAIVGTPGYMAPEQAAGEPVTAAADWYSFGVMLYQALTGRVPFVGSVSEILLAQRNSRPRDPRELAPAPDDLAVLCLELLGAEPRTRPSGEDVLARLGGSAVPAERPLGAGGRSSLVGRVPQLQALDRALDDLARGQPIVVLVEGASGMGKSTLVRHFLDKTERGGAGTVLVGRCHERESVPYKALDGVVDALTHHLRRVPESDAASLLPRDPHALSRLFPVFGRLSVVAKVPRKGLALSPQEQRRRAFAALREILARMADRRPLCVFIDDLQWGDDESVELLGELLREPDPPALLLLLAYRHEDRLASPHLRTLRERLSGSGAEFRELHVAALSREEARALARSVVQEGSEEELDRIAEESGQAPLFVLELARALASGGSGRGSLEEVLAARVTGLAPNARRLLDVLSVATRPIAEEVARHASGLARGEAQEVLGPLRLAHLVRSGTDGQRPVLEPYHDQIRVAVTRHHDAARARELHAALARALEACGSDDVEALATHFRLGGEPERARPYTLQAAARAANALAFDRGIALYRAALADATGADRAAILTRLGEVLSFSGRGHEAAEVFLGAVAQASPTDRVELERRAAEQLLRSGDFDAGMAAIRSVLEMAGISLPSSRSGALASLLVRRARLALRGLDFRERPEAEIDRAVLARIDACWTVGTSLSAVDLVRGGDFQTRHLLHALDAGEPYRVARGLALEATVGAVDGTKGQRRAAAIIARASELAQRMDHPHAMGWVLTAGAVLAWCEGRWRACVEQSSQAIKVFQSRCTDSAWEVSTLDIWFRQLALLFLGELGRFTEAVALSIADAEERNDRFALTVARTAGMPWVHLAGDQPGLALEESTEAIARWSQADWHLQHQEALRAQCLAEVYAGDPAAALARLDEAWPRLRAAMHLRLQNERILTFQARAAAVLAAEKLGPRSPGRVHLVEADARRLAKEDNRWAEAVSQALLAGVAAARRQPDAAARYERAASAFAALGMALHAAAARRRAGELTGGTEGQAAIERADRELADRGVVAPDRFASILVP